MTRRGRADTQHRTRGGPSGLTRGRRAEIERGRPPASAGQTWADGKTRANDGEIHQAERDEVTAAALRRHQAAADQGMVLAEHDIPGLGWLGSHFAGYGALHSAAVRDNRMIISGPDDADGGP